PALAVLLTLAPALVPRTPLPPAAEVVQWRQRRLLEQLGFPGSKRAVRVLRKLHPAELDVTSALALQRLCRDEDALARLSHLPRITRALLAVARTPERFRALEREVQLVLLDSDSARGQRLAGRLEEVLISLEQARRDGYRLPARLRSADHVRSVRGELTRLRGDVRRASAFDALPPPPYPGIPGRIEPLRSIGDLDREGREVRNCVRSYRSRALDGRVAIYRVLQPERATLSIVPGPGGWHLGELKGTGNSAVRRETTRMVRDWLGRWRYSARVHG
ncbi:MAG: PcfJ domain-containing protein, partial [Deltaproteobacteria bacterium]|nr:PcfJ domain-containing protein [Deltaproteobacteria bacterium]